MPLLGFDERTNAFFWTLKAVVLGYQFSPKSSRESEVVYSHAKFQLSSLFLPTLGAERVNKRQKKRILCIQRFV